TASAPSTGRSRRPRTEAGTSGSATTSRRATGSGRNHTDARRAQRARRLTANADFCRTTAPWRSHGPVPTRDPRCRSLLRTSSSHWQTSYPCADVMLKAGHKKAVLMFWNYSFGQESMAAFKEGYAKGGGTVAKEIAVPFPSTEFQANLSEIASLKPDAVFV